MDTEKTLAGKKIAILIANGFEETHLTEIQRALIPTGASMTVISPENGLANSWHGTGWGHYFAIDKLISEVLAADFDMMVLPGGVRSVAKLRENPHTKRIVSGFMNGDKPVAAIGTGAELITLADKGKSLKLATAESGTEIVKDRNVISCAGEDCFGAYIPEMIGFFAGAPRFQSAA
jgi:putative intracellular protease/amidase